MLICVPIYINGKLSGAPVLVVFLFGLLCTVLIISNRLRTLRNSRVSVNNGTVDLSLVLWDGYTTAVGIGRRQKIRSYSVFGPFRASRRGAGILIEGNVVCQELVYESGRNKRKEQWRKSFLIPPYFHEWEHLVYQITGQSTEKKL